MNMATKTKRIDSRPFANTEVRAVFDGYADGIREALLRLRELIFEVAESTDGVGELEETLKWGQPSYLTHKTKSGTTVRISDIGSDPGFYGIYVHCTTTLVSTYREMYSDVLKFDGTRGVLFSVGEEPPEDILRHCIELALTYHARKKQSQ